MYSTMSIVHCLHFASIDSKNQMINTKQTLCKLYLEYFVCIGFKVMSNGLVEIPSARTILLG